MMLGSTEGGLKYLKRDVESIDPDLLDFARTYVKPGHTVWDIGANLGYFTFAAAGMAGPSGSVVAVEPDVWLVSLLRRAARVNGARVAPVSVLTAAVAGKTSISAFNIAAGSRATNALDGFGLTTMGGVREKQLVPTLTLDLMLEDLAAPHVVKIDVEGVEIPVLRGAERVLSEVRPVFTIEVARENRPEVTEILSSARYSMIDGQTGEPMTQAGWSTIALPM